MTIQKTTFTLNITISEEGFQVEGIEPIFPDGHKLGLWLTSLCPENPKPRAYRETRWSADWSAEDAREREAYARAKFKQSKPTVEVWYDTKAKPAPKSELREMDEVREEFKRLKRKHPRASVEVLQAKAREMVEFKRRMLAEIGQELGSGTSQQDSGLNGENPQCTKTAQASNPASQNSTPSRPLSLAEMLALLDKPSESR
jgi:hypothetical protein